MIGPKYPDAGLIPFAAWKDARADFVRAPKYPFETPDGIVRNADDSRAVCNAITSAPVDPIVRFRVKGPQYAEFPDVVVVVVVVVVTAARAASALSAGITPIAISSSTSALDKALADGTATATAKATAVAIPKNFFINKMNKFMSSFTNKRFRGRE